MLLLALPYLCTALASAIKSRPSKSMITEDDIVSAIRHYGARIREALEKHRHRNRSSGDGIFRVAKNEPEFSDFMRNVRELPRQKRTMEGIRDWLALPLGVLTSVLPITRRLEKLASEIYEQTFQSARPKLATFAPSRSDGLSRRFFELVQQNLNDNSHLRSIPKLHTLTASEHAIWRKLIVYNENIFTDSQTELAAALNNNDPFIAVMARNLRARELTRLDRLTEALDILGTPTTSNPGFDSLSIMSMRMSLRIQTYNIDCRSINSSISDELDILDSILKGLGGSAPRHLADVTELWINEEASNFYSHYGMTGLYSLFNAKILSALMHPNDAERILEHACRLVSFVSGLHRNTRLEGIVSAVQADTALRMCSHVAFAADHVAKDKNSTGLLELRRSCIQTCLMHDGGFIEYVSDFKQKIQVEDYVKNPRLQCIPLFIGELHYSEELDADMHGYVPDVIDKVHSMKKARAEGLPMINTYARSCDFICEKFLGTPRSDLTDVLDATNYRLFVTSRISD